MDRYPPHPGEFITAVYLEPNGLSGRELAAKLGVAPSTLNHRAEDLQTDGRGPVISAISKY
jgi:plasmid maintenance system antidote protein VapI